MKTSVLKKSKGWALWSMTIALMGSASLHAEELSKKAPAFELPSSQGKYKLADSQGKLVYLDFWASWCGPCKQSFPWMNAMQEKYGSQNFEVIAINLDANSADANQFLSQLPAKFRVLFDASGTIPKLYGVKGMPTSVLIDKNGMIVMQHMGFSDKEKEKLEQKIQSAL